MTRGFSKIWIIGILAVVLAGGFFSWQYFGAEKQDETANWQTYTSSQYEFEFKYPPNYVIAVNSDCGSFTAVSSDCLASLNIKPSNNTYDPDASFSLLRGVNSVNLAGQVSSIIFNSQRKVWVLKREGSEDQTLPVFGKSASSQEVVKATNGGSQESSHYYLIPDYTHDVVAIFQIPQYYRLRCDLIKQSSQGAECDNFHNSLIEKYNGGQAITDTWLPGNYLKVLYADAETMVKSFKFVFILATEGTVGWQSYQWGQIAFKYPLGWIAEKIYYSTPAQQAEGQSPENIGVKLFPADEQGSNNFIAIGGHQVACDPSEKHAKCQFVSSIQNFVYTDSSNLEIARVFDQIVSTVQLLRRTTPIPAAGQTSEQTVNNQDKTRDLTRELDMKQIDIAQEMYYDTNGVYFASVNYPPEIGFYMPQTPTDPATKNPYGWVDNTKDSQKFCVYATLAGGGWVAASNRGFFKCSNKLPTLDNCCF